MDWTATLKSIAPTVATALLGPLGGAAVSAIGSLLGVKEPTQDKIAKLFSDGQLTPEQLSKIRELEMQYQNEEKERGFKYADLAFRDRDSARNANVMGGTQKALFGMSVLLLLLGLGVECVVLFKGYPATVPEIIVGRVLGLMDAMVMMVLAYWYGTTEGSRAKNEALASRE